MRMRGCNAGLKYHNDNDPATSLDHDHLRQDMDRIAEVRTVILDFMKCLQIGIMKEAARDPRPTRIQSDELPTFLMLNSIRWYDVSKDAKEATSVGVTEGDDEDAEVGESGMLLGEIPAGSDTATSMPDEPTSSPLSIWTKSISNDIESLLAEKSGVLYRLTSAIILQIEKGRVEDASRPSGTDTDWMGPGLADETRSRLGRAGFTGLRAVRGFGRESVFDSYYSIGVSLF